MIKGVSALASVNFAADTPARQHEVPDQIEDLVPHALVLEPELIVNYAIAANDDQVLIGQMGAKAGRTKLSCLFFKDVGPGGRNFSGKCLRRNPDGKELPRQGTIVAVVQIVNDIQLV